MCDKLENYYFIKDIYCKHKFKTKEFELVYCVNFYYKSIKKILV